MTAPNKPTRRAFLAGAFLLGYSIVTTRLVERFLPSSTVERLTSVFRHRQSAGRVGWAYLSAAPQEAGRERLVRLIVGALPHREQTLNAGDRELQAGLAGAIRSDYQREATVEVDGWVLSATEARLCALTSLD